MNVVTEAEWAEFGRRSHPDRAHGEAIRDPLWRLCNLYRCTNENGQDVWFTPTLEQRTVLICIFIRGWRRIIIPKARQLGMSLLLCLIALDGMLWRDGFRAAWVDKKLPEAEKKMREKILYAFDRLPAAIRAGLKVLKRAESEEFTIQSAVGDAGNPPSPSTVQVGVSFRGGTVEMLVLSEWGWIQANDRQRSKEINDGALPAAERAADGLVVVETTWDGGLDGELGPYVREALDTPEEMKGPKSWRLLFFGWQTNALYRQSHGSIDMLSDAYFRSLVPFGVTLTHEQKLWYAEKRRTNPRIKNEYPTLMHECWEQLPEGSIYGDYIEVAKGEGRVLDFLPDKRFPVHTVWDLGHPLNTVTWLVQVTPMAIRWIDVLMEKEWTLEQRAAHLRALGWDYGVHCIPWESGEANSHSIKPVDEFRRVLGPSVRVVPRVLNKWTAINGMKGIFPRFVFLKGRTETGLEHLGRYRAVRETASGIAKDEPVHDKYSHAADAARQLWQAMDAGIIASGNVVGGEMAKTHAAPQVIKAGRRM